MNKIVQFSVLPAIVIGMLALWGCPKKTDVTASPEGQTETAPAAVEPAVETSETPAAPETAPSDTGEQGNEASVAGAAGMQSIYFDFDRSFIRDDAKDVRRANADWLKANPAARVKIEGNCDERGTVEYNQALGQRRARSAKKYLTDLGIAARRISLISYGKEKPLCTDSTEECWQQNRRDDFTITE